MIGRQRNKTQSAALCERIADLIDGEDKSCPITDEQIGEILQLKHGMVAYYRNQLEIPRAVNRLQRRDYVSEHRKKNKRDAKARKTTGKTKSPRRAAKKTKG